MAATGAIKAGQAYVELVSEDSKLQATLKSAQERVKKFSESVNAVGREMLTLGTVMTTPLALSTKIFADFDDQMRMVKAVTNSTGKEFWRLTELAKKLGRETSFTATQVSLGMTSLGRMGFNPKEIENAIKPTMDLSRATGTELAESCDIAANSLRIFGMQANRMGEAADLLATTANGSAQTLTDLFEALKMAGPSAVKAGESLKDVCAQLGILANMGIKGSLAGTALAKSYKRLANPKVQNFLAQYNITTVDATGNLRKMRDILIDLGKVMKNMPSAEKITFAEEVFDARGSLGGSTLAVNTDGIDEFLKKLDDCEGAAARTAKEMENGIGGTFRELLSALEGVSIAVGEIISEAIMPLAKSVTGMLLVFRDWIAENPLLVKSLLVVGGGAIILGGALLTIGTGAKIASMANGGGLKLVSSAMAQLTVGGNRLGAVLNGITGSFQEVRQAGNLSATINATGRLTDSLMQAGTAADATAGKVALVGSSKNAMTAQVTAARNLSGEFLAVGKAADAANASMGTVGGTRSGMTVQQAAAKALATELTVVGSEAQAAAGKLALVDGTSGGNGFKLQTAAARDLGTTLKATANTAAETGTALRMNAADPQRLTSFSMAARSLATDLGVTATAAKSTAVELTMAGAAPEALTLHGQAAKVVADDYIALGSSAEKIAPAFKLAGSAASTAAVQVAVLGETRSYMDILTGSARKLVLSLGLTGTAAEVTAAKIILLNNAAAGREAWNAMGTGCKAACQSMLALYTATDRWQFTTLKSLDAGKAMTAVMLALPNAFTAETAAKVTSTLANSATTVGYTTLGIVAKGACISILALGAAFKALWKLMLAHPFLAVAAGVMMLLAVLKPAKVAAAELADEMDRLRERQEKGIATDELRIKRLQQLAQKQRLTKEEMAEARKLASQLDGDYENQGIHIDEITRKIEAQADAWDRLNEKLKTRRINAIDNQIRETKQNIENLRNELKKFSDDTFFSESGEEQKRRVDEIGKSLAEQQDKLNRLMQEKREVKDPGSADAGLKERLEKEAAAQRAAADEAAKAAEVRRQAEEKLDRESRTNLQNKIADIEKEAEAHKKAIQTELQYEKSKKDSDAGKIAELEAKLTKAEKAYQQKIEKAKLENKDDFTRSLQKMQEDYANVQQEIERRRKDAEEDREIAKKIEEDPNAGIKLLDEKLAALSDAIAAGKKAVEKAIKDAAASPDPNGKVDKDKAAEVRKRQEELNRLQQRQSQLQSRRDQTADSMESQSRKDAENYERRQKDSDQKRQERRQEEETDRKIDQQFAKDPEAGIKMINDMIDQAKAAAEAARKAYDEELKKARDPNSDGGVGISEKEKRRLDELETRRNNSEDMVDKYTRKLLAAQDAVKQQTPGPTGSFFLDLLSGQQTDAADRTAKATEAIAENTKKTNKLLKDKTETKITFKE